MRTGFGHLVNGTPGEHEPIMNRASIPHTKTFTGCWTCRSRHVKCDEQRPECGPCQKRKVPCEGYGVRLVWNPDEKGISRPSLNELRHEPTTILGARQLAAAIGELDEVVFEAHDSYRNGPFSVFNINDQAKRCNSQPTIVSTPAKDPPGSTSDPQDIFISSPEHRGDISLCTSPAPNWNGPSPASTERIQPPPPETNNTLQHSTTPRPLLHPGPPPPFLNPNPLPPRDTVLVHHWVTFVCTNSVLVDSATNFFRTIYTPLAVHPGRTASAPQAAVYHALCAAAAYSRARVCPLSASSAVETTTATRHETAAVRLLQHSLDPAAAALGSSAATTTTQKEAVLAAIILLTLIDIIRGTTAGAWRAHMRGGRSWIEALGGAAGWEGNDADGGSLASSVLYQQFRGGAVVASLQDSEGADDYSPDGGGGGGDGVAGGEAAAYHLDLLYGVPKDMFDVLVRLRKVCAAPEQLTEEEKEAFEMQLYLSVPSLDAFPVQRFGGEVSRMVHLHTAHLFYYAMLIHFKRRVRRVPPAELQDLVSKSIEHLEAVEEMPQHALGVTITWPCLVVACEADDPLLRERLAIWLQKKKRHGFGIIDVAANVVLEVWRRREGHETPGDINWMDVLGEINSDILLC